MIEKKLVNLYVPCLGERVDIYMPDFLPVRELVRVIGKMLEELYSQRYVSSGCEMLSSLDQNLLLHGERTLKDYNVQNGEHLLFC